MTKYTIRFADEDTQDFPIGIEESEYGGFETYEEALAKATKTLNETREFVENLLKELK